ncbi:MAG: hypothetical protein UZ11_BCD004001680, partial [Bacteroidetes bacterium OLB11]
KITEKATSIYYKTIAYMYRFSSKNGFLIFPKKDTSFFENYRIKETDGTLKKIGLAIPQSSENFKEYIKTMSVNEEELRQHLMTGRTPNAQHDLCKIPNKSGNFF